MVNEYAALLWIVAKKKKSHWDNYGKKRINFGGRRGMHQIGTRVKETEVGCRTLTALLSFP